MMGTATLLNNLVSVSDFNHGKASQTFKRVQDDNPVIVLKNNKPAAVIVSPDDYRRLTEAEEDFVLYQEAMERLKNDDGTRLTEEEVFGKEPEVDDGYEPEFE
ncbi:type II toxin-antitoxin system Phd/YefM family antitoxin [Bifidobacterium sp. ESL0732]|uniref:type II toxin-antitoxin system Phd/YefM family antitoxin n=1 Tax=Bifidobacterium sp. ESL0732 TaxID=2983222 RepID=UPI0023F9794A|nr:type II toxin-antitoxin system Phd/YefM family antitoxin [Bifidobacterium sp. ESL0732]WEV63479.1 type II toxin-antitoxin system Phd/YefM family antitoxin [Bifidobacterium sp. ESL0732]